MAQDIAEVYAKAGDLAEQVVAEAFGPQWGRLPRDVQRQIIDSTWRTWADSAGARAGLSRTSPGGRRRGVELPRRVELLSTDMPAIERTLRPIAQSAASQFDWEMAAATLEAEFKDEDEVEVPSVSKPGQDALTRAQFSRSEPVEQLQIAAPEVEDTADREAALARISEALATLDASQDASEQARSLLVRLHLGQRVMLGTPRALQPPVLYSRTLKAFYSPRRRQTGRGREGAFDDFMRYHAVGRAQQATHGGCPTCRLLARFVRVRGMTPAVVTQVMNDFVTFVRVG